MLILNDSNWLLFLNYILVLSFHTSYDLYDMIWYDMIWYDMTHMILFWGWVNDKIKETINWNKSKYKNIKHLFYFS